jgi:hypothetical protein
MRIDLSPVLEDTTLSLHRAGDVLAIDGASFDLGPLPEGATLPRAALDCPALAGDVTRKDGVLCLVLRLPHGSDAAQDLRFPAPLDPVPQGAVPLPGQPAGALPDRAGTIDWAQLRQPDPDAALAQARADAETTLLARIEAAAEALTGRVPLVEKLSWTAKEEAGRAALAGTADQAQRSLIDGEAQITGEDPARLAQRIVANADAWRGAVALLAGLRRRAMAALAETRDPGDVAKVMADIAATLANPGKPGG